ncbi:carbohydrate ABC transporter permease [Nonomuraea antimicrobica]
MSASALPAGVRRRRVLRRAGRTALGLCAVVIGVVSVFPFFWMLLTSVKPDREIFTVTPQLWTFNPTLERFELLLSGEIGRQLVNSLVIALGATGLAILFGTLAAYALSRFDVPGRRIIAVALLAIQMLPAIVVIIPLFTLYRTVGLLNTYAGVIIAHMALSVALAVWLVRGFLAGIPVALDEAAMVDGADRNRVLIHIIFPWRCPGSASARSSPSSRHGTNC